jgi:hypothetical protein
MNNGEKECVNNSKRDGNQKRIPCRDDMVDKESLNYCKTITKMGRWTGKHNMCPSRECTKDLVRVAV